MDEIFLKPYDPREHEDQIYKRWEESGFFNPEICIEKGITLKNAKPYTIVLPPPNVTGTLHMGHAAMLAVEDILIRHARMNGRRTLWIPGTDSAALATQEKVEKEIYKKEKKTRHDLGREGLLRRIEQFTKESHDSIVHQIKKMGSSLDWSREAYTLDEERNYAVLTAFKRMYDAGLIYRGNRIVNWDPQLQTNVSDDEVDWIEEKAPFYYLKYGPFTIGTARPETKFGDKYIVMHPDDARYKNYKNSQQIEVEWINGPITATIIKDPVVNMEFGTGVMTITPWHDPTDFDIAERHNLDKEQVIDLNGKLLPIAKEFAEIHIKKARPLIVEKLKKKGLVEKIDEEYVHRIATNSRGGGVIEPQIREQWFVDVHKEFILPHSELESIESGKKTTLKEILQKTVRSGQIEIIPGRFEKQYFHWIDNLRDWCISRQIWFGHRIPVWYRGDEIYCDTKPPKGSGWKQDLDTLDTWFSSGLWTFSTLGWPKEVDDLRIYHPTSVLETGYDILFFWVARMILMSGFHLGQIPFEKVYLHGLVRDERGRKMSKSLGNIIDPLDMTERYGADATRLSLIIGATAGNDIKLSEDRVRGYKHFANKIWNVSRFVLENIGDTDFSKPPKLLSRHQQHLDDLTEVIKEATQHIETFRLDLAGDTLYHYFWHTFADILIEEMKPILKGTDKEARKSAQWVLYVILTTSLKLLHPFMPFITEIVWEHIPKSTYKTQELLMVEEWPKA